MSKRILALILSIVVLLGVFPADMPVFRAKAEETRQYQVKIVSFADGAEAFVGENSTVDDTDLRSSELLEARLYVSTDGGHTWTVTDKYENIPVTRLYYEWTNGLGTYLYLYNSHNMYGINDSDGEEEISKEGSYSGRGFAWAAIYGYSISAKNLMGTIGVTVKTERNGGITIGSDTHEGTSTGEGKDTKYHGIVGASLKDDINAMAFGIFEGDTKTVTDMLGEAGIVHITCEACSVSRATVEKGENYITVSGWGKYQVTGKNPGSATKGGDAQINITISKTYCKFHAYSSGTGTVPVYVYKKPKTTTTATTLTLTNLDSRCTYYIDGVQGTYVKVGNDNDISNDYVLFEGLTPNTNYTVTAKGKTEDTAAAYAYVYDKTKPSYTGTIKVIKYTYQNTKGELTDIKDIFSDGVLVFRLDGDLANIATERISEGTYRATLSQGVFYPHLSTDGGATYLKGNQQLVVTDRNVEATLRFYQVDYDLNGGSSTTTIAPRAYISGASVHVSDVIPQKEGYIFAGWKDTSGKVYSSNALLTGSLNQPYLLTAQWEEAIDVYLNVKIQHYYQNEIASGYDQTVEKDDISLDLVYAPNENTPYLETEHSITITNNSHDKHTYIRNPDGADVTDAAVQVTTYKAKGATFTGLQKGLYTVATSKHGYDVTSITSKKDSNGNVIIDVELVYAPLNQDLAFEVNVSQETPVELVPQAAIVKILFWSTAKQTWEVITQQADTATDMKPGVRVNIDSSDRKGTGSYPVWVYEASNSPYGYRIVVTSLVYPDGTIVHVDNELADLTKSKTDLYKITIGNVADGKVYGDSLYGAYFEENAGTLATFNQIGTLDALIHTKGYDVTFDAQGGLVKDQATHTVTAQYKVPSLEEYTPVREGGYLFDGWYLEDSCVNPAVEGVYLTENITLYAKWKEPLKIQGTVTMSGTYLLDGNIHTIHDVDRAKSVMVALQKNDGGNITIIDSQRVDLTYGQEGLPDVGIGTYVFEGVKDDGALYQIQVLSANYETLYRHEPASATYSYNHQDYNKTDYNAEYGDDKIAVIDAYMMFAPESFNLNYQVDATAIGDGFKPTAAEMLVLYDDGTKGSNPHDWAVISQMVFSTGHHGQKTGLNWVTVDEDDNGITESYYRGNNSYSVWNEKPDGATYYDYAILLNAYTDNTGKEVTYVGETTPFDVIYNGSARYDATVESKQTQLLTATLVPKQYLIRFDLGFTETAQDHIGDSMQAYRMLIGSDDTTSTTPELVEIYATSHTWSYPTNINAAPIRAGYSFDGWFVDLDGDKQKDANEAFVTQIDASVHADMTLTAAWTKLANVYVHVTMEHEAANGGGRNNVDTKHNVIFTVEQIGQGSTLGSKTIQWNGTSEFNVDGYTAEIVTTESPASEKTIYTATQPTMTNAVDGAQYTASVEKSGYSVVSVISSTDTHGNIHLHVELIYDPQNFDFEYTLELDAAAKTLPAEVKPVAVRVKVTSWYNTPNDADFGLSAEDNTIAWYTITQQRDTYSRVTLDTNGVGKGKYPVWKTHDSSSVSDPYYYRIEVIAYELPNGTVLPVSGLSANQPSIQDTYATEHGIYSTKVQASADCVDPDGAGGGNTLTGAYHDGTKQVGQVKGVISIQTHTITFVPNGGKFGDGTTTAKVVPNLVYMPNAFANVPTRTGYTFDGWTWTKTVDGQAVTPLAENTLLSADLTLTAVWTPVIYTITYETNGGSFPTGTIIPTSYDVTDAVTHPIPTWEGYEFLGWYEDPSCTGAAVTGFGPGQTGDKVFYADWKYDLTTMTIRKTFAAGTEYDPEQTFIFRVVCQKEGIDLRVRVKGSNSVTINGLPIGEDYIVTEETQWSWQYTPTVATQTVTLPDAGCTLVFENKKIQGSKEWVYDVDDKSNRFE